MNDKIVGRERKPTLVL